MAGKSYHIRAGDLRQRVSIRLPVETKNDTTGGFGTTYRMLATRIPASVQPQGGKRLLAAGQLDARTSYVVRLRHRQSTADDEGNVIPWARQQVVYHAPEGDRVLDITAAIDVMERHVALQLSCTESE